MINHLFNPLYRCLGFRGFGSFNLVGVLTLSLEKVFPLITKNKFKLFKFKKSKNIIPKKKLNPNYLRDIFSFYTSHRARETCLFCNISCTYPSDILLIKLLNTHG